MRCAKTRIYVVELAAYNAGYLYGIWLNASEDIDDIQIKVSDMLKQSPVHGAEEYTLHDYEGFAGCSVYEYEGLESVHEKAVFVQEHGELDAAVLAHIQFYIDYDRKGRDMDMRGDIYTITTGHNQAHIFNSF